MDGDRKRPAGTLLIGVPHQLNENKRQKQRGQEIKGTVLVAGNAVVGARLFARQLQVNFVVTGDIADVLVLKYLKPGTKADNDAAPDAL